MRVAILSDVLLHVIYLKILKYRKNINILLFSKSKICYFHWFSLFIFISIYQKDYLRCFIFLYTFSYTSYLILIINAILKLHTFLNVLFSKLLLFSWVIKQDDVKNKNNPLNFKFKCLQYFLLKKAKLINILNNFELYIIQEYVIIN